MRLVATFVFICVGVCCGRPRDPWSSSVSNASLAVGPVTVSNFPLSYTVAGSLAVTNLPGTYPVSGAVSITNFPASYRYDPTTPTIEYPRPDGSAYTHFSYYTTSVVVGTGIPQSKNIGLPFGPIGAMVADYTLIGCFPSNTGIMMYAMRPHPSSTAGFYDVFLSYPSPSTVFQLAAGSSPAAFILGGTASNVQCYPLKLHVNVGEVQPYLVIAWAFDTASAGSVISFFLSVYQPT